MAELRRYTNPKGRVTQAAASDDPNQVVLTGANDAIQVWTQRATDGGDCQPTEVTVTCTLYTRIVQIILLLRTIQDLTDLKISISEGYRTAVSPEDLQRSTERRSKRRRRISRRTRSSFMQSMRSLRSRTPACTVA